MYKGTDDILDKMATNKTLTALSDAVCKCKQTVGLDEDVIQMTFQTALQRKETNEMQKRLSKIPSILVANPRLTTKWLVYTNNIEETRRELLEAGHDLKDINIIDGN